MRRQLMPWFMALTIFSLALRMAPAFSAESGKRESQSVAASANEICPLLVNAPVPKLTLRKLDGSAFDLNAALKEKPTVVIFYRGGWCPFCNLQLGQLQKIESQLVEMGFQLIAISPDRPEKLRESVQKHKLTYVLLSDSNAVATQAFGLAFKVSDKTLEQYKGFGIDLEDAAGAPHHVLPVPAVFIVGKDGIIQFEYINPNYKVRLNAELLLVAAKAAVK